MNVIVQRIESFDGSVITAIGLTDEGDTVWFGGDVRPMLAVCDGLNAGDDVEVEIEEWQILKRWAA